MVARNTNLHKVFWIIWPTNLPILSFLMKVNHETGGSHYIWHLSCCYYHWFDTSARGLLVPEGIIRPLVLSRFWISCLGSLVFRFQKPLKLFGSQNLFTLPLPETRCFKFLLAYIFSLLFHHILIRARIRASLYYFSLMLLA